ncbi:MAG: Dihydrolipoamide dehydrogenase [Firmicutes bacterium]|nr:Dihydrolipoamide dehydrogenase [Bacillota bacterium]
MDWKERADLVILGGGPAGYLAAIRAAQLGSRVTIVEHDQIGGVCLNRGCIPTKALLRTAEFNALFRKGAEFGVTTSMLPIDWSAAHSRKARVVKSLRMGVEYLLRNDRIHLVKGKGDFTHFDRLKVETEEGVLELQSKKFLVATGSVPMRPPIPGIDAPTVLTSNEILEMEAVPNRLTIIGGGVIGLEFAQMFNELGSKVTIIEMADQVLPNEDGEMAAEVLKSMKRQRIAIQLSSTVTGITAADSGTTVKFLRQEKEEQLEADYVLLAAGRKPSVPRGLLALGAVTDAKGALIVNEHLQTSLPGIYAAGDVIGGKMLAHKAYAEGRIAVENALGMSKVMTYHALPSCVYIQPELAAVGMTEQEAVENGYEVRVGRFMFRTNGRALCMGEREGLVKVVTDSRSHIILGAQIFGSSATELISEMTMAIAFRHTADEVADLIHPHPTLSEAVMEACADAVGRSIHKA